MNKRILFSLIIGLVIFISGLYLGYKHGLNKDVSAYQSTFDESVVITLNNEIKLLKYIRSGDIDSAKEMLESLVDVGVSYLGVNILKKNSTDNKIIGAIKEAKEYRDKFPDHKPNKVLSKTIEETFQKVSKQQ
jgi:hypothetical protein